MNINLSRFEYQKPRSDFHHSKSNLKPFTIWRNDRRSFGALLQINTANFQLIQKLEHKFGRQNRLLLKKEEKSQ